MALYLKYRPQTLGQIIGQEVVKNTLLPSFRTGKLAHAYLFVGPRGTGKTSTARILAKMVNCSENQNLSPCNKCDSCISITDGSNLDLIEIDAASNRGIDDIRSLRENIKLSPTGQGKKIYIIDEVHMLTTEAFNALLKTLEEPPSHALFILATTEAQKIPQTILSRVQRLDFRLASADELMVALKVVIDGEKIDIDSDAVRLLVKKADGSFRDGIKLLEQLSSSTSKITIDDVENLLKSTKFETILTFLEYFSTKERQNGLLLINQEIQKGVNIKDLTSMLMDCLRSVMLIKNDLGQKLVKEMIGSEKYQLLLSCAEKFEIGEVSRTLDILQNSLEKLKFTSIQSLPLELAIMEICNQPSEAITNVQAVPVADVTIALSPESSEGIAALEEKWNFVLETVRPYNYSLEALLRSAKIVDCSLERVLLEVPYSFHQRILEAPKSKDLLESVLSDVLGRTIKVSTVLGNKPLKIEDLANVEVAADDEIIRAASEIFNGTMVD